MVWYSWLTKSTTQSRKKLHLIVAHLAIVSLLLLAAAILGVLFGVWEIALEVFLPSHLVDAGRAEKIEIQLVIYTMW